MSCRFALRRSPPSSPFRSLTYVVHIHGTLPWVWPGEHQQETGDGRVALSYGLPVPPDRRLALLPSSPLCLLFPEPRPAPRPLRSREADGAPLLSALEYCTSPVASPHAVHSTKSTPFMIQVHGMILMKVCDLVCDEILADNLCNVQ